MNGARLPLAIASLCIVVAMVAASAAGLGAPWFVFGFVMGTIFGIAWEAARPRRR